MENIDKIFVINLDSHPERLAEFYDEMKKANIASEKIERFSAILAGDGIGCTASHLHVLKIARERRYKNILIFEDDFTFIIPGESFHSKLSEFFQIENLDWKILMISYNNEHNQLKPYKESQLIGITNNCQTSSGYLINSKYFDEIIACLEYGLVCLIQTHAHWLYTIDQVWKSLQKDDKWFYMLERCGKQRPFFLDGKWTDYDC